MASKLRILGLTVSLGVLSACVSQPKVGCADLNWHTLGFEDGVAGEAQARPEKHTGDCEGEASGNYTEAYATGYRDGIAEFCTASSAYRFGRSGGRYRGQCPEGTREIFLQAFEQGREQFLIARQMDELQSSIRNNYDQIEKLQAEMRRKQDFMATGTPGGADLIRLRSEVRDFQSQMGGLAAQIIEFEQEILQLEDQSAALQASVSGL